MSTNQHYVYWKKRPEVESTTIGGLCAPDNIPAIGYTDSCPLPTTITTTIDEQGNLQAYSPVVFGTSRAFRYSLFMSAQGRADIAAINTDYLDSHLTVLMAEAPRRDSDRANWWWYNQDQFRCNYSYQKIPTPVRLMITWKAKMLAILLDGHPEKDAIIARWEARVDGHKAHQRAKNSGAPRTPPKEVGDLVVMPYPIHFNTNSHKQVFRYEEKHENGNRRSYCLKIGATRYSTPHSAARPFHDGTAPDTISPAVRAVLAILAWERCAATSAHAAIAANHRFGQLVAQAKAAMPAWIKAHDSATITPHTKAALAALLDFGTPHVPEDDRIMAVVLAECVQHRALLRAELNTILTAHAQADDTVAA